MSTFSPSSFHPNGKRRRSFYPAKQFHAREITWISGLIDERQITACRIGLLGSSRPISQAVLTVETARPAAGKADDGAPLCRPQLRQRAPGVGRGMASCRRQQLLQHDGRPATKTPCAQRAPSRSQRLPQGTAHRDTCRPDRLRRCHMCLGLRLQNRLRQDGVPTVLSPCTREYRAPIRSLVPATDDFQPSALGLCGVAGSGISPASQSAKQ